jgi:uncharacterized protein
MLKVFWQRFVCMNAAAHSSSRPLAVVTGASSGIGWELARHCTQAGMDLVIAADDAAIHTCAEQLQSQGVDVVAVQADLATPQGIEKLRQAAQQRPVHVLCANAGSGLRGAFLDQDFEQVRHVINTNVTGTLQLVHVLAQGMRAQGQGRVLITGSIAGYIPGAFNAVYNASKAFIDSFAVALHRELEGSGVTVTCLMPGATDTAFFERAGLQDTKLAHQPKDDPAEVTRQGFEAMMRGDASIVTGLRNKLQVAATRVVPEEVLADQHARMARPGSAR